MEPPPSAPLPAPVERALGDLVDAAREAFGPGLRAAVLYGSAAEGLLRPTSDVNLILVLASFDTAAVDRIRGPLRVAEAAAKVEVMYLLESEIPAVANRFASKFADILRRRRVLHGPDPFAGLVIPRAREAERLRTESLNFVLHLRAAYASRTLREEQAVRAVADSAGPLRAMAAALLDIEGRPAPSPREALLVVAAAEGPEASEAVARLSEARETGRLPAGTAAPTLLVLLALVGRIRERAEAVR
jgi:predicted nucleotidyltransferase